MLHLITGFRRTGKDTLYNLISAATAAEINPVPACAFPSEAFAGLTGASASLTPASLTGASAGLTGYLIYAGPETRIDMWKEFKGCDVRRTAFADALKYEVQVEMGVTSEDWITYQYEAKKDTLKIGDGTLRDLFIRHADMRRAQNIDYWAIMALARYATDMAEAKQSLVESKAPVGAGAGTAPVAGIEGGVVTPTPKTIHDLTVTDWRFQNEESYSRRTFRDVRTTRIFRSEVPIPDISVKSEHDLDNVTTDFLLVTSPHEFDLAVKLWPQYASFKLRGTFPDTSDLPVSVGRV